MRWLSWRNAGLVLASLFLVVDVVSWWTLTAFAVGLGAVLWGWRVVNEITFDVVPDSWVRDHGTAG
jgi:hypothetical protein